MGGHLINMTGYPEAILAAEAEIIYSTICLIIDYDCQHEHPEEQVNVNLVTEWLKALSIKAKGIIMKIIEKIEAED